MFKSIFTYLFAISFSISTVWAQKMGPFDPTRAPQNPNYESLQFWVAHPFREDKADLIPRSESWISDSLKDVDVFYIYPTIYTKGKNWNADVYDKRLNRRIANYPVKYQASVFNKVCRVYAPYYRQAIVKVFYEPSEDGEKALDFAYQDIKLAFEQFLLWTGDRPIIIASHSQGTYHAARLLKDYFDGTELQNRLVCAYVVGLEIYREQYDFLVPCSDSTQTGCYVTWSSFSKKYDHINKTTIYYGDVCVNPITWNNSENWEQSKGSILLDFKSKQRFKTQARRVGSYLEIKTKTPIVQTWKNMHLVDYNLFWDDIRKNVGVRVRSYKKNKN
ncbi:MAG TPA: DUF3089 domain-containing protein [Bacteroidia bacterium]